MQLNFSWEFEIKPFENFQITVLDSILQIMRLFVIFILFKNGKSGGTEFL